MTEALTSAARRQRILAVVLPHLLCELALQRLAVPPSRKHEPPRAIVLIDGALSSRAANTSPAMKAQGEAELEGKTELDAVNSVAHQLGIRPRQTIAQASACVESLIIQALPRARVFAALKHIAEVALRFGSPVSFQPPDTVWVDVSGSSHLFENERELALEVATQIKTLGHSARVVIADGPWLAQSFARHAQLEDAGILLVDPLHTARAVCQLPIMALPIHREALSWFSRLGLLNIQDLRALPTSALAARLEGQILEVPLGTILDLIQGRDAGVLVPHVPEEMPREELFWEDPLGSVEPLLFVLKGLSGRLSARLEGRGQAAQELLLTLHYDRSLAALATPEGSAVPDTKSLSFKLASPLFHAEDLERVMRLRLQRQNLIAPTLGLGLQATAVTDARHCQLNLSGKSGAWASNISSDPRTLTVLIAELSADIGPEGVGVLATEDSHLLEKSSALLPVSAVFSEGAFPEAGFSEAGFSEAGFSEAAFPEGVSLEGTPRAIDAVHSGADAGDHSGVVEGLSLPRAPTRLLDPPLEIHAPIRKSELWVIREQAFTVVHIHFEQRLEGVEWWERTRVFRDYFRVWLARVGPSEDASSRAQSQRRGAARRAERSGGLEALVYRDREQSKTYLQALYD
jgi:protein ImuB